MIKFVLGSKGSGKTKWLVDRANKDIREGNENIVFIDVDHEHIFTLDYDVRLINAMEFNIENIESFYGFLSGILASNYDIEKIYVDSLYKMFNINFEDMHQLKKHAKELNEIYNVDIYLNVDYSLEEIPKELKDNAIDVEKNLIFA